MTLSKEGNKETCKEGFYHSYNLDFRDHACPIHPHLNHLSSDLCQGVVEFLEEMMLVVLKRFRRMDA